MIDKQQVISIAEKWLNTKEGYFLVDVDVTPDNRIVVEIDQAEGVWIDDCVDLSRFIEASLDRDVEDYELEVGSAGIGQPFKVLQQVYLCLPMKRDLQSRFSRSRRLRAASVPRQSR